MIQRPQPVLGEMPLHIKEEIVRMVGFQERSALRKLCSTLRWAVDTTAIHLKLLEIHVELSRITVTVGQNSNSRQIVYEDVDSAVLDLEILFRNSKLSISEFSTKIENYYGRKNEFKEEFLRKILEKVPKNLKISKMSTTKEMLPILPFLDRKCLKSLKITEKLNEFCGGHDVDFQMSPFVDFLANLEELETCGLKIVDLSLDQFWPIRNLRTHLKNVKPQDILKVKELAMSHPNEHLDWKVASYDYDPTYIQMALGDNNFKYSIPETSGILEIKVMDYEMRFQKNFEQI